MIFSLSFFFGVSLFCFGDCFVGRMGLPVKIRVIECATFGDSDDLFSSLLICVV